ncbi:MAG TPA: NapC/NirT family cytochrome c, partial [Gemmatimonadaceae bacterium]|nr:NapC/NirT family cytochrome c [Gemmatimonadaceae bacterium]
RTIALGVIALTVVNVIIVALAANGAVHAMESNAFCGQVCHTTMEPQATAHRVWPHANVSCTQCHVGPGAESFVEAKLAGTRQLFHVVSGRVPRPIPPPSELIQPARATCEGCHWPDSFHGDIVRVVREYAADEANTESTTTLRLHVGGGSRRLGSGSGIHWHMNLDNQIDFLAGDDREEVIPYVRVTGRQGQVREYFAEGTTRDQIDGKPLRRMDCMDCHNRPAHTFDISPERAVNAALADGRIPRQLPFVRREAVNAVRESYPDKQSALAEIGRRLSRFYDERGGVDPALVRRAVAATQDVWANNVFPAMRVTWGTYPNHIGHVDSPGCSRCHDDSHKAADGKVISQDCELCHTLPE